MSRHPRGPLLPRGLLAGVWLLACAAAAAAEDAGTLVHQGRPGVAACASCHGPAGAGQGTFPRLAAMDARYLAKQLDDLAAGRRDSPVMAPIAKALRPAERAALAQYYARQPAPPADAAAAPNPQGEHLALRGAWRKGTPACVQCHGPGGVGVGAAFPALAGQPSGYIAVQLKAFRAGTRANDPLQLMRAAASRLTDDEIEDVALWFAHADPRRGGAR